MTVRRLLRELDSLEITQWVAYEQVFGPLGGAREDVLAGVLGAAVMNSQRTKNSDRKWSASDFLPEWDQNKPRPQRTWQELLALAQQANAALGGTVNTKGA
jgi:hypothetical protein